MDVRSLTRTLLAAVSLLLLAPLHAAANWTYASSDHFEVFTTSGSRQAREALEQFERIRAFFADHLKLTQPAGRRVRLILFANAREFRPYRINDAVVAYYRPGSSVDYIVMQPLGRASHSVMVHEYVHLLMTRAGGRYPLWAGEGLAEYYATLPSMGNTVPIGRMSRGRLRGLSADRLLGLDRLFAVTHESPEYRTAEHGGQFYAQSLVLMHMLHADERYRDGASRFLAALHQGTPSAQALMTVYGRTIRQVEGDLADYLRGGHYASQLVRFQEPSRPVAVSMREVPSFEAGLLMANLLAAAPEDAAKARAAFEQLASQNADDLALLESRAALEFRTRQPRAARPFLERAVELESSTASSYRDLAALVVAEDVDRAELLLDRAIALDPDDTRARVHLATLVGRRSQADVLAVLAPVTPANVVDTFDVLRLRANAYLALDDLDRALVAASDLVQVSWTRQRRAVAERILASVEARRLMATADVSTDDVAPVTNDR